MTRRKIPFAIIGGGLMGREFASAAARWGHLLDLSVEPEVVAVCDEREEALDWFKANCASLRQTVCNYSDLLANPAIEAVYCAVPHHLHQQVYTDVIQAGKHLLGEKPFGIDGEANAAILDAAARRPGLAVRCASEFPFFPGPQRIVELAREDSFGKILEVECGFLHSSDLDPSKPINWKRMARFNGEYGCMGDLGMHVLHIPLRLGWKPLNVRAILSNVYPERNDAQGNTIPCDTWDNAAVFCEAATPGGWRFPMTLKTQRIAPGETNTWYVSVKGTRLCARFSTKHPKTLETMPYEPGKPQAWRSEDLGYASVYKTITGGIFEFGFSDAILQMIAAFCDGIALGPDREPSFGCVSLEETRLHHRVLTAALESQRAGQVVAV